MLERSRQGFCGMNLVGGPVAKPATYSDSEFGSWELFFKGRHVS